MSGNIERTTYEEPVAEEIRRVRPLKLEDRLWAITRIGVTAFLTWLITLLVIDGVGRAMYGIPSGETYIPEVVWILSTAYIILFFILWGFGVTVKHYGGGRLSSGLKLPFKALKEAILIATGKKTTTDEEDYDVGY